MLKKRIFYTLFLLLCFNIQLFSQSDISCEYLKKDPGLLSADVCPGKDAYLILKVASPGVWYSIFNHQNELLHQAQQTAEEPGKLALEFSSDKLNEGLNVLTLKASAESCGEVILNDNIKIQVLPLPSDSVKVIGSYYCKSQSGNPPEVTVVKAQPGVVYTLFIDSLKIGETTVSGEEAKDIKIAIPFSLLSSGSTEIHVYANYPGCPPVKLKNNAYVIAYPEFISFPLSVEGSWICPTEKEAWIKIKSSVEGQDYYISISGLPLGKVTGNGQDLKFTFPAEELSAGKNSILVRTSFQTQCQAFSVSQTAEVYKSPFRYIDLAIMDEHFCYPESPYLIVLNRFAEPVNLYFSNEAKNTFSVLIIKEQSQISIPEGFIHAGKNILIAEAIEPSCNTVMFRDTVIVNIDSLGAPGILYSDGTLAADQEADEYIWKYEEEILEGQNQKSIIPGKAGKYYVGLVTRYGCYSDFSPAFELLVTSAISESLTEADIFPNPSKGKIYTRNIPSGSTVYIYDVNGIPVKRFTGGKEDRSELDVSDLKGIYMLTVEYGQKRISGQVIIID
jgi:hypothetical protein